MQDSDIDDTWAIVDEPSRLSSDQPVQQVSNADAGSSSSSLACDSAGSVSDEPAPEHVYVNIFDEPDRPFMGVTNETNAVPFSAALQRFADPTDVISPYKRIDIETARTITLNTGREVASNQVSMAIELNDVEALQNIENAMGKQGSESHLGVNAHSLALVNILSNLKLRSHAPFAARFMKNMRLMILDFNHEVDLTTIIDMIEGRHVQELEGFRVFRGNDHLLHYLDRRAQILLNAQADNCRMNESKLVYMGEGKVDKKAKKHSRKESTDDEDSCTIM